VPVTQYYQAAVASSCAVGTADCWLSAVLSSYMYSYFSPQQLTRILWHCLVVTNVWQTRPSRVPGLRRLILSIVCARLESNVLNRVLQLLTKFSCWLLLLPLLQCCSSSSPSTTTLVSNTLLKLCITNQLSGTFKEV
jgi:hypothetical protein